jgi:6-phosphofructokinase 1
VKKLAVLTSGGDAPGMNAAIRAVVRVGVARGFEVLGVRHGYTGLMEAGFTGLGPRDVGGIIGRGGTILGSTRCAELKTEAGQAKAVQAMQTREIDGLVIIGGNGTQAGADALSRHGVRVVGIACTIDNDLAGADITIGATTALDVILEAMDRIRVTASSHRRAFLVEVMGRDCGYLALMAGIAGGAEAIVVPEANPSPESVAEEIRSIYQSGRSHAIIVVAEGAKYNAESLVQYFKQHSERLGFDLRTTKLGHVQRGGVPGVYDRLIATQLGAAAVAHLEAGDHGIVLGIKNGIVTPTPLSVAGHATKAFDSHMFELAKVLAR